MNTKLIAFFALAPIALWAWGCGTDEETFDPGEAVASVEQAETQSGTMPGGLLPISLSDFEAGMSTEQAAQQVADTVPTVFEPEGCATATVTGSQVQYTLNACILSRGLGRLLPGGPVHHHHRLISGSFTLTFEPLANQRKGTGFEIAITGSDVTGRHASFELSGQAELTVQGTLRTLLLSTEGTGSGRGGHTITRTATHTRTWDEATDCVTIDGQWQFQTPRGTRERSISGFKRCGDGCPEAGGTLIGEGKRHRHRHGKGMKGKGERGEGKHGGGKRGGGRGAQAQDVDVTVSFDGSAVATWSSSDGHSGQIPLSCTP